MTKRQMNKIFNSFLTISEMMLFLNGKKKKSSLSKTEYIKPKDDNPRVGKF